MNPHSTYANLSDEERAGLDARGSARERLLTEVTSHTSSPSYELWYRQTLDAIEADAVERYRAGMKRATREAVAAERVRLAEAFRALGLKWESDADVIEAADTSTKARRALSAEVLRLCAAELLALLEDTSTPSKAEPGVAADVDLACTSADMDA